MTRRLIVLSGADGLVLRRALARHRPGDTWDVLATREDSETIRRRYAPQLGALGADLLDLARAAPAARDLVARFVIDTYAELPDWPLGGTSLRALLGIEWWWLEATERSPFRGPLIPLLYRLALIRAALASTTYEELWIGPDLPLVRSMVGGEDLPRMVLLGAADRPMSRDRGPSLARRYLASGVAVALAVLIGKLAGAVAGWPRLPGGAAVVLTIFPFWWRDPFGPGAAERFIGDPPPSVWYLAWPASLRTLVRWRSKARALANRRRIVSLLHWVRLSDLMACFDPAALWRARRFADSMRQDLAVRFAGFDVAALIADDIERSMVGVERARNVVLYRVAARFALATKPAAVIYRCEFQPLEHALVAALRGHARTIGFRHSPFTRAYIPMRFAAKEVERAVAREHGAMPLPDGFIVSGSVGRDALVADGIPPGRIATCGPQRHPDLIAAIAAPRDRSVLRAGMGVDHDTFAVFVAVAIVPEDTRALLAALSSALPANSRVVLRTHPARPVEARVLRLILRELDLEQRVVFGASSSLHDQLSACDVAVLVGSTLAFEAMALGIIPVVFENPSTFAATSLEDYDDSLFVVRTADELASALEDVRSAGPRSQARRQRWPATIARVFSDLATPLDAQLTSALSALALTEARQA